MGQDIDLWIHPLSPGGFLNLDFQILGNLTEMALVVLLSSTAGDREVPVTTLSGDKDSSLAPHRDGFVPFSIQGISRCPVI